MLQMLLQLLTLLCSLDAGRQAPLALLTEMLVFTEEAMLLPKPVWIFRKRTKPTSAVL
jgi:hypothetical protein